MAPAGATRRSVPGLPTPSRRGSRSITTSARTSGPCRGSTTSRPRPRTGRRTRPASAVSATTSTTRTSCSCRPATWPASTRRSTPGSAVRCGSPSARPRCASRFEPIVRRKVIELIDDVRRQRPRRLRPRPGDDPCPGTTMFSWFGFPGGGPSRSCSPGSATCSSATRASRALPARAIAGRDRMRAYMQAAAASAGAAPREDLMSFLVDARRGGQISADELLGSSMLLFVAGITTTSGLISNSLLHLDRFPDQRNRIRDDPSVIPAAIEELLRFDAPIQALARTATRDVAIHDAVIPAGARVALVWASANRDERRWDRSGPARHHARDRSATSRSAMGSTTASALRSPGSRRRSSSRSSSNGSRSTRWPARSSAIKTPRTERWSRCPSSSDPDVTGRSSGRRGRSRCRCRRRRHLGATPDQIPRSPSRPCP